MNTKQELINETDDNEFWLSNDDDVRDLCSQLSDDILLQTIYEQIESNLNINPNDILYNFNERYHYILVFYGNDERILKNIKELKKKIYLKILDKLCNKFDFTTELNNEDISADSTNLYLYTDAFYNFFILNYRENIIDFFTNYLFENAETLIENYKNTIENKNDLMIKSLKKSFHNSIYAYLLYLTETIILDYINNDILVEDLIKDFTDMDEYEYNKAIIRLIFLKNKYNTYAGSDFINRFFAPLKNEEYRLNILIEIKSNLVNLIKIKEASTLNEKNEEDKNEK